MIRFAICVIHGICRVTKPASLPSGLAGPEMVHMAVGCVPKNRFYGSSPMVKSKTLSPLSMQSRMAASNVSEPIEQFL